MSFDWTTIFIMINVIVSVIHFIVVLKIIKQTEDVIIK